MNIKCNLGLIAKANNFSHQLSESPPERKSLHHRIAIWFTPKRGLSWGWREHYSWFHQDKDGKAGLVQTGSNCLPIYVTPLPKYSGQKMMIPTMVNYHFPLILRLCHPDHFPQKSYIFPLPHLRLECPSCLCMTTAFSHSKKVGPTTSSLPKQPLALCTSRPQPRLPPGQDLLYTA